MQKNNAKREKAFLVGVILKGVSRTQIDNQLDELKLLAHTAGADILSTATQSRHKPDAATFIGKGKLKISKKLPVKSLKLLTEPD